MFHLERGGTPETHDENRLLAVHVLVDVRLDIVLLSEIFVFISQIYVRCCSLGTSVVFLVPGTSVPCAYHNRKQ